MRLTTSAGSGRPIGTLKFQGREFDRLKPGLMAAGAFLLTLGVTTIPANAALVFSVLGNANSNAIALVTTIGVVLASVGAALLAYGIGAKANQGNPMQPQ